MVRIKATPIELPHSDWQSHERDCAQDPPNLLIHASVNAVGGEMRPGNPCSEDSATSEGPACVPCAISPVETRAEQAMSRATSLTWDCAG